MVAVAARYLEVRRKGLPSRLIALVAVFAFALQALIAQTHIHGVAQQLGGIVKTGTPLPRDVWAASCSHRRDREFVLGFFVARHAEG